MAKHLVIVESPAKAKTIGQYLGPDFMVYASYGHVSDLPKSKLGIDVDKDFAITYGTIPKAKKVLAELKAHLAKSDALYLAPDADREGEAIAWHLVRELKPKQPVHRISFTEITKSAVTKALENPRKISQDLVDAQQARRALDRLVGYKLSPLLWQKVYRGLSAGRVQSVAVRLVVEREREIKAHKVREFWTIEASLKSGGKEFPAYLTKVGSREKLEFDKEADAQKAVKQLQKEALAVSEVELTEAHLKPAAPLITSTLQQLAARVGGFSAKRTMKLAQDLYEGIDLGPEGSVGLITYMRTDSHNFAESFKKEAADQIKAQFGPEYIPKTPNTFTKKVRGAQEAHEAIRPTHISYTPEKLKDKLSKEHHKLYSMIWQAAAASQMAPAQVKNTVVTLKAGAHQLIGRGRALEFDGFLKVLPGSEERFEPLPELKKDQKVDVKKVSATQHLTEPPARYSEATLVRELEKRGIGRPSTYAPIVSTIVDRGYVTKQAGRFSPEAVADVVTDLLVENFPDIMDYDFTADLETQLDDIAEGEKKMVAVLKDFYGPFAKLLKEKEKTIEKKELTEEATDQKCPDCNKPVVIKLGRFGKFYACSGYPDCKYRAPFLDDDFSKKEEAQIAAEIKEKCPDCGGDLTIKQSRFGTFIGCGNYPKCKFTKSIEIAADAKCPNCGKPIHRKSSRKGRVFWGCSGYPKCKTAFWDEPVAEKCPQCNNLLVKKKSGLACSQCDFVKEAPEPEAVEAEKA